MSLRLLQFMPGVIWNHIRGDDMKGTINYLIKLRRICQEHKGDCKKCPLGKYGTVDECRCPRLIHPKNLTDDKIVDMIRI